MAKIGKERPNRARLEDHGERDKLDARLDEALKETFPASDSVAVTPPRWIRRVAKRSQKETASARS